MGGYVLWWGRKDAFPGADGSTIMQPNGTATNASTIPIYGANGLKLEEGSAGLCLIEITTPNVLNNNTTLTYAIKHPLDYIYNAVVTGDWYTNNVDYQDNNLWNPTTKSAYDPCPHGWHVPADGVWKDFTTSSFPAFIMGEQNSSGSVDVTNGRVYNNFVWYPATGRRRTLNLGLLGVVGENVCCWSSVSNAGNANNLNYTSIVAELRGIGMTVRCVQE